MDTLLKLLSCSVALRLLAGWQAFLSKDHVTVWIVAHVQPQLRSSVSLKRASCEVETMKQ